MSSTYPEYPVVTMTTVGIVASILLGRIRSFLADALGGALPLIMLAGASFLKRVPQPEGIRSMSSKSRVRAPRRLLWTLLSTLWLFACQLSGSTQVEGVQATATHQGPAAETPAEISDIPGRSPLANVSHWLYLIDVDMDPETVDRIAASSYDMVVIDFIVSEQWNRDFPLAAVIEQWHSAEHPKLVIAYIDIAEAEDYRSYWQPGWRVGNPEWIAGDDPDGWEGNFPVAYWHDEFDGVYLDWVEAYSDENVLQIAQADGVEAVQEMIWWVGDIAEFGHAQKTGFIVIAQNAAELAEHDDYVDIIDAIAQEQVWFDGGADNDPPGDCPLPRTEAEVDTLAYRQSLSLACRRTYDDYPESTLHISSEEYLGYLRLAYSKGLIIFTVDYALEANNVAWVYQEARRLGFIPFVGGRALDRYVEPYP